MRKDKHITNVLFLLEKDSKEDVFAYFPNDIYDIENILRVSYSHIGQHSSCHPDYSKECNQASPEQYNHLKIELEGLGYALNVLNETTPTNTIQEQKKDWRVEWTHHDENGHKKGWYITIGKFHDLINMPNSSDAQAVAELIVKSVNDYPKVLNLFKRYYKETMYPDTTNDYFESHWKVFCQKENIYIP